MDSDHQDGKGTGADEGFVAELTANQAALQSFLTALMAGDHSVDEVLQRTNITLWRKRQGYSPGTNFRAWAFECAKWTLRAYLKEQQRKNWLVVDEELTRAIGERMMASLPASPHAPHAALLLCLERLRPVDRDLLMSYYEEGRSLAECAKGCGRSVSTLKVTLFRVRAALRRCIVDRLIIEETGAWA